MSKYFGSHFGGQQGCGQHGLGSQQRGFGGQHGSQLSRSQQQLVKERAIAAMNPRPSNFFIKALLFILEFKRCSKNWFCVLFPLRVAYHLLILDNQLGGDKLKGFTPLNTP
ncbi:MAG: hypothetical protein ACH350_06005 [Parachlamydiaceae bacterium]